MWPVLKVLERPSQGEGGKGQTLNVSLTNISREYLYEALQQYFLFVDTRLKHFRIQSIWIAKQNHTCTAQLCNTLLDQIFGFNPLSTKYKKWETDRCHWLRVRVVQILPAVCAIRQTFIEYFILNQSRFLIITWRGSIEY